MSCPGLSALQAYLEGSATSDERDAIRAHLEACSECRAVVLAFTPMPTTTEGVPTGSGFVRPSTEEVSPGQLVGRFMVLHRLGEGGMGVVYAAYDPDLDRKVALKLIRRVTGESDAAAPQLQERLMHEAQAMARVTHPNVVAVHEVGRHQGHVFIAMELVHGETLAAWLAQQERPVSRIVDRFLHAGRGLAAAHAAGLVHRDFKPNNVMVDDAGRVRVMDFGLARPTGAQQVTTPPSSPRLFERALTASGMLLGTPAYMAPEQLARELADARSDQFSFCVALYEALCGIRPFVGEDTDALRAAILAHELQRPRRTAPSWLLRVVERGLKSSPAERWPSMDALISEMGRDRSRRRRFALLGAVVALVAVSVALVLSRGVAMRPCRGAEQKLAEVWNDTRRRAVAAAFAATAKPYAMDALRSAARILDEYAHRWVAMHTDACEATRVRGEQSEEMLDLRMECLDERLNELKATTDLLAHADAKTVERAVVATSGLTSLDGCANLAALRMPMRPPTDAATRTRVDALRIELATARALERAGKYPDGFKRAGSMAAAARALHYRPLEAEALVLEGELQLDLGDYNGARPTLLAATTAAEAGRHEAAEASAWTSLVRQSFSSAKYADGHEFAEHAQACIERLGGNAELAAMLEQDLGILYQKERRLDAAREHEQRALVLAEKLGPAAPAMAKVLNDLGTTAFYQGRYAEAREFHERTLTLFESMLGRSHPEVGRSLNNLGLDLAYLGQWEDALSLYRRALAIKIATLGPEHPSVAGTYNNIALAYYHGGRYDEALAEHRRVLAIREHVLGPDHPEVADSCDNISDLLLTLRRPDEAMEFAERAARIYRKSGGPDFPEIARPLLHIGRAYLLRNAAAAAFAPLEQALALMETNRRDPSDLADPQFALAQALWATHRDPVRARKLALAAKEGYAATLPVHARELAQVDVALAKHR